MDLQIQNPKYQFCLLSNLRTSHNFVDLKKFQFTVKINVQVTYTHKHVHTYTHKYKHGAGFVAIRATSEKTSVTE
jgi:hypothetical protein